MELRRKTNVKNLFKCFCEISPTVDSNDNAKVVRKFPVDFDEVDVLKSVAKFTYPCEFENSVIQHYSFVLTDITSKWTFGYCRHDPNCKNAIVILSYLPWHEIFYKLLNFIAILIQKTKTEQLAEFLHKLYNQKNFFSNSQILITISNSDYIFSCKCPNSFLLPTIPENRNLTEYYNAIDANNMITIFASILNERRIIFTSRKLPRLSSCLQSANDLLYPMTWQHIFIPILPMSLIDYLLAPMPFLIGVPEQVLQWVNLHEIGDVVILNADTNTVLTPFDDVNSLPIEVINLLKQTLRKQNTLLGDTVSRAFLKALVILIGGYRDALIFKNGEKIVFDSHTFIQTRPNSMQPFLKKMLNLQIFQQFIEDRLFMLNSGLGFSDEFEFEVYNYSEKSRWKQKLEYGQWMKTVMKEGSSVIKSLKNKANSTNTMKVAVKTFKHTGKGVKSIYKNLKSKVDDNNFDANVDNHNYNYEVPKTLSSFSAPNSPIGLRKNCEFNNSDNMLQLTKNNNSPEKILERNLILRSRDTLKEESNFLMETHHINNTNLPLNSNDLIQLESLQLTEKAGNSEDVILLQGGLSNPLYNLYNSNSCDSQKKQSDLELLAEYGLDSFKLTDNFETRIGKDKWAKFD